MITIEEYVYWTQQTRDINYADKKSVRKYNKAITKASEYWIDRAPDWCDEDFRQFAELVHHEDPIVRVSVVRVIILKVKLNENVLNEYLKILDSSAHFLQGDCRIECNIWGSLWKKGLIPTQNPYNGFEFTYFFE